MKKFDVLVYVGRFQPPHVAHIKTIEHALEQADIVHIFLGSCHQERTLKNPWSWRERTKMIDVCLSEEDAKRVMYYPVMDIPGKDRQWANQIRDIVKYYHPGKKVGIIGHYKDESSHYLNLFPEWSMVEIDNTCGTNATDIREEYFSLSKTYKEAEELLHPKVHEYLIEFRDTEHYEKLWGEIYKGESRET